MKLFQKFRRRELTPVEQLAEYESEIARNQSIIENLTQSIKNYQSLYEIYKADAKNSSFSRISLYRTLRDLEDCYEEINTAKANLKYYEVLRDHLKKELDIQNS